MTLDCVELPAQARLRVMQEEQLRVEAELARATAALEAACSMEDVELLRDALGAARKAKVGEALCGEAEVRLEELEAEARLRAEEEAKAKREAEARARRKEKAAERLRGLTDAADDEAALATAIDEADEAGVDGHAIWMASQVLANLEEAREQREAALDAARATLDAALELGDVDALRDAIEEAAAAEV